ncbi:MAG TPA: tetratricopeptide repeat protein [Acidobacteriaceae bacterium]|nr:tetratricopeptide repeat protein [Acidobacteriaceae bacterium]
MVGQHRRYSAAPLLLLMLAGIALERSAAQGDGKGQDTSLLAGARRAAEAGDLATAERKASEYQAAKPNSAEGMYLMGRILEARDRPKESLEWFTRAAAVIPPSGEELRLVGLDYVLLDAYPEARHWLSRSVEVDAGNAEAWYDLGRAQMMEGDFSGAQQSLERALVLKPRLAKAENNLGVVYETQNLPIKAAMAYQQAIAWQEADPHPSEQPLLNYGVLLLTQGRNAEALPLLRKAVKIAPQDVKCREQLARALDRTGDTSGAIESMAEAVRLQPNSASLHFELGQIYRRAGALEKAKQELILSQQLYGSHSSDPMDKPLRPRN